MKKLLFLSIALIGLIICLTSCVFAQGVGINSTNAPPDPSAIIDANSTNKGMLIPRMTTSQRDAIVNPAQALQIYNLTTNCFETWVNGLWQTVWCAACPPPAQPSAITGNASPCNGTSEAYSVINVPGVSYTWTFPSGWIQTAGNSTNLVAATVGTGSGNIQVIPSNLYCGNGPVQTLAVTPQEVPVAPSASTNNVSATQITWNWNTVPGATGYKYNTVNNYSNATDNNTNASYTQPGLTCGSSYTLYVWAYNICGNSPSAMLTQASGNCCADGTGGTITHIGGNTIHTFTSTGAFSPTCPMNVQILVVAGGGGASTYYSGGGGAGGVIYNSSVAVTPQSYNIVVGGGGVGTSGSFSGGNLGGNGGNSSALGLTAIGGGGGGSRYPGSSGGSGGGGGNNYTSGGSGTSGQGNNGGNGNGTGGSSDIAAGGGGGAGVPGISGVRNSVQGVGGDGLQFSISGTPTYYGGGGSGGSSGNLNINPAGGAGGGGSGGCNCAITAGSNGVPNTGGGAGGGGENADGTGASGGSGIVIISYITPCVTSPSAPTAGTSVGGMSQIVWNWNTAAGATGYKYNIVDNYSSATDVGLNTTYTQTGLSCNSSYTLYVWAYNSCGNSTSIALTQSTSPNCCPDGAGGTITHVGGYTIHTFSSSGTFTPACAGNVQVLVVAGGGGATTYHSGGGGGGGVIYNSSVAVTPQAYNIVVGGGGAGISGTNSSGNVGSNGQNSSALGFTAIGGGGGGSRFPGGNGGSGGGGGNNSTSGGSGSSGQGNSGGNGSGTGGSSEISGGGGGGAGAVGTNGVFNSVRGVGGDGLQFSISGTPTYYGGGGGGGNSWSSNAAGGPGGGGTGGCHNCGNINGTDGTLNTGGGAGGGGENSGGSGASGGSGIVIISYLTGVGPSWTCGNQITVNHIGGDGISAVSKSITYGTVLTNLSGASKCWITQNLGAEIQASSYNDGSSSAQGWYWQFNRQQGYQVNGSVTPAWTISSISENSDWIVANDPCTISLGTGWRIPTQTEWTNVTQNLANISSAYNSVLKIHAGGTEDPCGCQVPPYGFGSFAEFWASTQAGNTTGWSPAFDSGTNNYQSNKAYGFSLRCIKD